MKRKRYIPKSNFLKGKQETSTFQDCYKKSKIVFLKFLIHSRWSKITGQVFGFKQVQPVRFGSGDLNAKCKMLNCIMEMVVFNFDLQILGNW